MRHIAAMGLVGALLVLGSGGVPGAFARTQVDTTPPVIQQPPDITTTATTPCGQSACATINYSLSISDPDDPPDQITVSCTLPSGGIETLGMGLITCQAHDAAGNNSNIVSFHSTVVEPPPTFSNVPGPITVQATSSSGAVAHYTTPTATDLVDGNLPVSCDDASGIYVFPIGTTTVTCKATNSNKGTSTATFPVTVTPLSSSSGGGSGTSGSTSSSGGSATSSSTGTSSGSGSVSSSSAGGSPPATAAAKDTTPPTLADHTDIKIYASTLLGATVTYTEIATDPDDTGSQIRITCLPASGSMFPLGPHGESKTTTVTCTANDAAGNNAAPTSFTVTVLGFQTQTLKPRTRAHACALGSLPDRRCSPGAYYPALAKTVICSAGFRAGEIGSVPVSEKLALEREYGLDAKRGLGIGYIVPLELGGSNDIANLYPEKAKALEVHARDKLANAAHGWVCAGKISLGAAQQKIATNWQAFYRQVFGVAP